MNEDKIRQIVRSEIASATNTSQYGVANTPFHLHNGMDSNKVPAQFLDFDGFMIWGKTTFSGTSVTITNRNILETSTILATSGTSYAFTLSTSCTIGSATIGGGVNGQDINYLIIF